MTDRSDSAERLAPILCDIARPVTIWAAHFIFVYAAFSAACADRGLVGFGAVPIAVLVVTVIAVIGAGRSVLRGGGAGLRRSARWSGIISIIAIVFTAAPTLLVGGCG